jgi:hypothetical protein
VMERNSNRKGLRDPAQELRPGLYAFSAFRVSDIPVLQVQWCNDLLVHFRYLS